MQKIPNLSLNIPNTENSLPLKSIPDALNLRSQLMQVLEQADMTLDP